MRNRKLISSAIIITLTDVMIMVSCTHKSAVLPDVSFNREILPVIQASCSINSNCHVGAYNANGHIDLSDSVAYNTIVSKGLNNFKDPTASLLYSEVQTGFMPKSPYPMLSADKIYLILTWIKQGAKP